jgi:serine/threonine-protein kinase HipA
MDPNPDRVARQTAVAGADSAEDEVEGLRVLAADCGLTPAETRQELAQIVDALTTWRSTAEKNGAKRRELPRSQETCLLGIETLLAAGK